MTISFALNLRNAAPLMWSLLGPTAPDENCSEEAALVLFEPVEAGRAYSDFTAFGLRRQS
jgi:hypothetical protein